VVAIRGRNTLFGLNQEDDVDFIKEKKKKKTKEGEKYGIDG